MREGSIFHAGHEDDREFQALRGVNRHEGHLAASAFFFGKLVGVRDQGNALEESRESDLAAGRCEVKCDRVQFGKVFHSRGILRVLGASQSRQVSRAVKNFFEDLRSIRTCLFRAAHGLDQSPKITDCRGRARAEPSHAASRFLSFFRGKLRESQASALCFPEASALRNPAIPSGRAHRNPIAIAVGNEVSFSFRANSAAGSVQDAPQCDSVVGVRDHLKVSQGVFDFRTLVEASASNDSVGNALADQKFFDCS